MTDEPRCEPADPTKMGVHHLLNPGGGEDAGRWLGPDLEWWFGGHTSMTATAAAEMGWKYVAPVPSPEEIAALVRAAREAEKSLALAADLGRIGLLAATVEHMAAVKATGQSSLVSLNAALAPFKDTPNA